MKLAVLLHHLQKNFRHTGPDLEVVVVTKMPSIGPRCLVPIESAAPGIDWEHGKLVLTPKQALYTRDNQTEVERLRGEIDKLMMKQMHMQRALRAANELCEKALPKFNWGASALDAEAIQLLNEVPSKIKEVLS